MSDGADAVLLPSIQSHRGRPLKYQHNPWATCTFLIDSTTVKSSAMAETTQPETPTQKSAPGATWKNNEEHIVPKNRLGIVFAGLMCSVFLAALDQVFLLFFVDDCFPTDPLDHCRDGTSNDSVTTWRW